MRASKPYMQIDPDMLLFQWYLPLFVSLFTEIESDYFMFICKS